MGDVSMERLVGRHWQRERHSRGLDDHPGFVYIIGTRHGDSPVKIGYAQNPAARLTELQCGNPEELVVLATIPARPAHERWFHLDLAAARVRGEWFDREAVIEFLTNEPHLRRTLADFSHRTAQEAPS